MSDPRIESSIISADHRTWDGVRIVRVLVRIYLVVLILAVYPYSYRPTVDIKNFVTATSICAVSILLLWSVRSTSFPRHRLSLISVLVLLFAFTNLLSALVSDYRLPSLMATRSVMLMATLFLIVSLTHRRSDDCIDTFTFLALAVAASSLYGFCQRVGWDPLPWEGIATEEYRGLPATFGNPNYAAHVLITAILIAGFLALQRRSWWFAASGILMLAHLYMTKSRGGVISLASAIVLIVIVTVVRRFNRSPFRGAMLSLLLFALVAFGGVVVILVGVKLSDGRFLPLDESLLLRYNSYFGATQMIMTNPILGFGPGGFELENPRFWTPFEQYWFAVRHMINRRVHNDYLEAGVETGLPGMGVFTSILVSCITLGLLAAFNPASKKRARLGLLLAGCWCAISVDALFGFTSRTPTSMAVMFVLAGMLDGMYQPRGGLENMSHSRRPLKIALLAASIFAVVNMGLAFRAFTAQVLLQNARAVRAAGASELADDLLAQGERKAPWNPVFATLRAQIALDANQPSAARSHLVRALSLSPNGILNIESLAHASLLDILDQTRADSTTPIDAAAAEAVEKYALLALQYCPQLPESHSVLGTLYYLKAEHARPAESRALREKAAAHYAEALRYAEKNKSLMNKRLALCLIELGDVEKAEHALRSCLRAKPDDMEAWSTYYRLAAERQDFSGLIQKLERTLDRTQDAEKREPDLRLSLYQMLARAYFETEPKSEKALDTVLRALNTDPDRLELWGAFALLQDKQARIAKASEAVKRMKTTFENEGKSVPDCFSLITSVCAADSMGIQDSAHQLLESVQAASATASPIVLTDRFVWLADILLEKATTENLSIEIRSNVFRELGVVYLLCGSLQKADTILAAAIPNLPTDERASALLQRNDVLTKLGNRAGALQTAIEAQSLAPNNPNAAWAVARSLAGAGRLTEAKTTYESVLIAPSLDPAARRIIEGEYASIEAKLNGTDGQPRP